MHERKNMPQKYRIEGQKPHLWNIFKEARTAAIQSHIDSPEYKAFLEEFVDTNTYTELIAEHEKGLVQIDAYLDIIEQFLNKRKEDYKGKFELKYNLFELFNSNAIRDTYNILYQIPNTVNPFSDEKDDINIDNWKELVKERYIIALDGRIEDRQQGYAYDKMNIVNKNWTSKREEQAFNALIYSLTSDDLDKMEDAVKNGLDYKALTIRTEEDSNPYDCKLPY